jgi:hypothetical protein
MFDSYQILTFWELMETFDIGNLCAAISSLSNLAHVIKNKPGTLSAIPFENYQTIKGKIDYICRELERLDFAVSLASARELRKIIYDEMEVKSGAPFPQKSATFPGLSLGRFQNYTKELQTRFKDEGAAKIAIILPFNKRKFYDPQEPIWGNEVQDKFPSMIEDIVEANQCFAFDRNTACVFHLMRVMEKAVQKLAQKMGLSATSVIDREWQLVINDIRGKLNLLYPKHGDPERIRYESILGHLETVKIAWRNPTMHPKATYGEKEAQAVLNAVEIFIEDVAKIF